MVSHDGTSLTFHLRFSHYRRAPGQAPAHVGCVAAWCLQSSRHMWHQELTVTNAVLYRPLPCGTERSVRSCGHHYQQGLGSRLQRLSYARNASRRILHQSTLSLGIAPMHGLALRLLL
eukprot:6459642-Amphidinium_carterae.1